MVGMESGSCWCSLGLLRNWQNEPRVYLSKIWGTPHSNFSHA